MIVEVAHPAPLLFTPRRGRNQRFGHVALRTPVELTEDDLSRSVEVGPMFPDKSGVLAEDMRILDGRLWSPVASRNAGGEFAEASLGEFVGWVSGGAPDAADGNFGRQFGGTPLVAEGDREGTVVSVMAKGLHTRGERIEVEEAREVRFDGRDRARAEVARYLSEEIRILDGRPFMRCSPLMSVNGVTETASFSVHSRIWPWDHGMRAFPATPATLDAVLSIQESLGVARPPAIQDRLRAHWAALVPEGTLEGDDVRHVLNAFAAPVRKAIDIAVENMGRRAPERLRLAGRALRAVEVAAMTGTAHREGAAPVLALREGIAAWRASGRHGSHGQEYLAAFLDRIVLPRFDAQAAADLDVDGLMAP